MPLTTVSAGAVIAASTANANWANAVSRDTSATITVTHTWTAAQTFTGGWTAGAACTVSTGGLTVTAGGLTVSAGTTAVQALTATTGTFSGNVSFGSPATTTGATNEPVLANAKGLRGANAAGTNTAVLISLTAGNVTQVGPTTAVSIDASGAGTTFGAGISATTGTFSGAVSASGFTGALTGNVTGNADTASTLQTTRTIWGQNFNGGANVSGPMTGVGNITMSGVILLTSTSADQVKVCYDASNFLGVTVSSAGVVSLLPQGSAARLRLLGAGGAGGVVIGAASDRLTFFDGSPSGKLSVSGSRGGNAALASLLTQLAAYGLITDSTSA